MQLATHADRANLEPLFEVEVLETGTTAAQICTSFRQELQPLRVERGFRARRLAHAPSYRNHENLEMTSVETFQLPACVGGCGTNSDAGVHHSTRTGARIVVQDRCL
jgi:hypothetical protein